MIDNSILNDRLKVNYNINSAPIVVGAILLLLSSFQSIFDGWWITSLWLLLWFFIVSVAKLSVLPCLIILSAFSPVPLPFGDVNGLPFWYINLVLVAIIGLYKSVISKKESVYWRFRHNDLELLIGLSIIIIPFLVSTASNGVLDYQVYLKLICLIAIAFLTLFFSTDVRQIGMAVVFGGFLVSIQVLLQYFDILVGVVDVLPWGLGVDYGAFHGALAGGLIGMSALFIIFERRKSVLNIILLFIMFSAIILSGKRTWFLSLFSGYIVYLIQRGLEVGSLYKYIIFVILTALLISLSLYYMSDLQELIALISNVFQNDMQNGRIRKWVAAFDVFLENPLFGVGFQALDISSSVYGLRGDEGARNADSLFINTLAQVGVIGVFIISVGCFVIIRCALRRSTKIYRFDGSVATWVFPLLFYWLIGSVFWDPFGTGASAAAITVVVFAGLQENKIRA